jgi:MFS family permease
MRGSKEISFWDCFSYHLFGYGRIFDHLSVISGDAGSLSFLEQSMGGGILSSFVSWVSGFGNQASIKSKFPFGNRYIWWSAGIALCSLQFVFAPIWGGLSDRYGRKPILMFTLLGTALGYFLWIMSGNFWLLLFPG